MKPLKRSLIVVGGLIAVLATLLVVDMASQDGKPAMAQNSELIPYTIIDRRELGSRKLSMIVEVQLVEGRLPYERELLRLTEHLISPEERFARRYVTYYLPGMKHGEGAFATGQYNLEPPTGLEVPETTKIQVFLRPYKLLDYPEYAKFAF